MNLAAYLDKGASVGPDAPCLTTGSRTLSYGEVQGFTRRVARALARSGVRPGDAVAVLSGNDPTAFARSEEHTSELQSRRDLVCRLLLEKKKNDHETLLWTFECGLGIAITAVVCSAWT